MADAQWWIEILQKVFGNEVSIWVLRVLGVISVVFVSSWLLERTILSIQNTFIPLFYNKELKRRIRRRQQFADHIESEIRRLNQREDWSDFRFAELEAEVEAEGSRKVSSIIPFIKRTSKGLRREKSLSKALRQSQEKIIIVEGEPGSGKSIALRHVAYTISQNAIKSKSINSLIPVYVNLKELKREREQVIDKQFVESFVIKVLKRINDRDVDKFIDDEFQIGMANGSWFFLFDSFDEIPEILSSGDADSKIREYADAIHDFLHGLNACRGVIASRYFKGPNQVDWPRFRILSLTDSRQRELIQRSGLKSNFEKLLLGNLEIASPEIKRLATNPLFLGLLINYAQTNEKFPQHSDIVFDAYINHRFIQDRDRVVQRFGVSIEEIREVAEEVAFCMSATQDLGLSPTRENIKRSFKENDININEKFDASLDALEFMKIARSDNTEITGDKKVFTFSHRKFQEYFPVKLILEKRNIKISELLTNPKWREITVVVCQTQSEEVVSQITQVAEYLLLTYYKEVDSNIELLLSEDGQEIPIDFPWPQGCLHLLGLLQEGFINRIDLLSKVARRLSGTIVNLATLTGSLPHRIWALEVAGIAPNPDLLEIIRPAIADRGRFLSDVAYRQVARLDEIPDDISGWIKRAILNKLLHLGIFRGGNVVFAQVSRLVNARNYIAVLRGIQLGHWIDIASSVIIAGILFVSAFSMPLADEFFTARITYRAIMIMFGFLALIFPLTIYSEDQIPFPFFRVMYVGVILSLFIPAMLILRASSYILILILYAPFVMSSLITAIDEIPFERSLIYVLFSPFFVVRKAVRGFLNAFLSLKNTSFSRRSKRILVVGIAILIIYCLVVFIPIRIWGIENGGTVVLTISGLGMLVMFYQMTSKIFLEDRKYRQRWRKWLSASGNMTTVDEMISVLPVISTRFAYKLIEKIRKDDMLQPTQANVYFIKQLIRLVENPFLDNEFSESLTLFLDDIGENRLKPMLLDELFQLVEKLESKLT